MNVIHYIGCVCVLGFFFRTRIEVKVKVFGRVNVALVGFFSVGAKGEYAHVEERKIRERIVPSEVGCVFFDLVADFS